MGHWFLILQRRDRDPEKRNNLFNVIQQVIVFCFLYQAPKSSMDSHSLGQYTWKLLSLQLQKGLVFDSSPYRAHSYPLSWVNRSLPPSLCPPRVSFICILPQERLEINPAVGRESGLPLLAQKRGQQQQQEILSAEVVLLDSEMRHREHMSLLYDPALLLPSCVTWTGYLTFLCLEFLIWSVASLLSMRAWGKHISLLFFPPHLLAFPCYLSVRTEVRT